MIEHEKSAYISHKQEREEDSTGIFPSPKREKFLFENSIDRKSAYADQLPLVTYRRTSQLLQSDFVMRITVDSNSITALRRLILKTCGDLVLFIRVKPVDHARKMKVWLCLSKSSVDTVIGNIMHDLPQAEFGKVTPLLPV